MLLMVGKGFTPAQQAWPALTLEGFAQLGEKRAQKKSFGPMRSVCWTDHGIMTNQQQIELQDLDPKCCVGLLRFAQTALKSGRCLGGRRGLETARVETQRTVICC